MKTLWIYNENCTLAGRQVPLRDLERYQDPSECGDWHEEEVSEENAAEHRALRTPYHSRIAATIEGALEF